MAKSKANGTLAVAEQQLPATTGEQLPVATASDFGGGLAVEGREETTINLARLAMFQGTPKEEKAYGQFKRGVFLDTLEIRPLGETVKIMPVFASAAYALWEKDKPTPTQTWESQKEVPKELLEWKEDPTTGKRIPPPVTESINVVCCVPGEAWPYLFIFKRTSMKAFERTINPLERRRASTGKCPGLYELGSVDDKNGANQDYKRLTARPVGDPPADTIDLAKQVFQARDRFRKLAAEAAKEEVDNEHAGYDPDSD